MRPHDRQPVTPTRRLLRWMVRQCKRVDSFRVSGQARFSKGPETMSLHVPGGGGHGSAPAGGVELMQVVGESDEYLTCRRLDDEGEPITTGDPIKVAKPYWFRRSSYDGLIVSGWTLTHTGAGTRTATAGTYSNPEAVSPAWNASGKSGTIATVKVVTMTTHVLVDEEDLGLEALAEGRNWVATTLVTT